MPSSTSNSEQAGTQPSRPFALTALLSVVGLFLVGMMSYDHKDAQDMEQVTAAQFWAHKTWDWDGRCDAVILGDSRAYYGFSPSAMKEALPGYRIGNFGYSNGSLSRLMLEAADQWLDPASPRRMIVLAVTPWSLTPEAAANQHYLREKSNRPSNLGHARILRKQVTLFFSPIGKSQINRLLGDSGWGNSTPYQIEYHEDGWVAFRTPQPDPSRGLESYRQTFERTKVSPHLVEELMTEIRRRTEKGILVFGVRPPTSAEMVKLENSASGFHEAEFVSAFEQSGGVWLRFDPIDYATYDGSHLDADSAMRFSLDLAERIKEVMRNP